MSGKPRSSRIESIDVLRGLTILVMIFVNTQAGVNGTPWWMEHFHPWDADGMTFVDVVFPAFLFIVGMSIPFAIGRRLDRGERRTPILGHILLRTVSLLICGLFMVNMGMHGAEIGWMPAAWWKFLAFLCMGLVFHISPKEKGTAQTISTTLKLVGIAGFYTLWAICRGDDQGPMQTSWWGILGLIGWAYLTGCLIYLFVRNNVAGLVGAMAVLYCLFPADNMVSYTDSVTGGLIGVGSMIGSHGALVTGGMILGVMLRPDSPVPDGWRRIRWAALYGAAMALAAHLLYQLHTAPGVERLFIVNKNIATPPWCLWSAAWTAWVWCVIYWLIDMKGWKRWAVVLRPAGENPLLAYILAPAMYYAMTLLHINGPYDNLGAHFWPGFIRSIAWAFAITWLAGFLKKRGAQLRL